MDEQTINRFGATAQEWLQRWDDNKHVWSVEMGGIGALSRPDIKDRLIMIQKDFPTV